MTDTHFNHSAAPLRIGRARLRVRDLDAVSAFYQRVIGLIPVSQDGALLTLGTAQSPLLELLADPQAAPRNPRDAGLFHTAFLMPRRVDLAHWLAHVAAEQVRLDGASDHIVSEAIYLSDPEGNGIEVYADRPVAAWRGRDGQIRMATEPLDMPALLDAGQGTWQGFPADGLIGHVHLQIGDLDRADAFYRDILGFDIAARYPGARFFGSGGYHHQLAGNVWNSRNAGPRPPRAAGLERVEIIARDDATRAAILARARAADIAIADAGGTPQLQDPWGTEIELAV
ncbi:MAG: putative ring-cleavage extradiol dioxygenase [Rhodobacteraceae bacterium HLUCCA12]|nr:MAG: putative ring-cleavage extradiol dioxygenase [Rhodobacteraceae bacterium HLUCCA12]